MSVVQLHMHIHTLRESYEYFTVILFDWAISLKMLLAISQALTNQLK
jgi:hypothetical protein